MNRITLMLAAVLVTGLLSGCKQKKQSEDIIVRKTEEPLHQGPIRMQEYKQTKDFKWLGKDYQADIRRMPDDSLRMVKDETGQLFVDNRITLNIFRSDGSTCFSRTFTKASFDEVLDDDYRRTGILEGLVFDRVEDNSVLFAGSVCHPQTDEYIPLVVSVSNFGDVTIKRDDQMDTNGIDEDTINQE